MKNIDWPSNYKTKEFTIAVIGDNAPLYKELTKMSKIKKIANQQFKIAQYDQINNINMPHILYLSHNKSNKIKEAVTKLKGKSTLIVTEKPGMAKKGAAINFVIVKNRQNFELNQKIIKQHNLKVSSTLKNLAIMVN